MSNKTRNLIRVTALCLIAVLVSGSLSPEAMLLKARAADDTEERRDFESMFESKEEKEEEEEPEEKEEKEEKKPEENKTKEFSWYEYIRDNIAPEMGWASLETESRKVGENWVYPTGWDFREGLLSAQITDLDKNGTEDCVLYYFDLDYEYFPGNPGFDDKSTVYVKVLTRNSDGTVSETGARQVVYEDGTGFCDAVGGIMEFKGRKYVYFECNTNAYYANGYGTLYTFYSYDGTQLRPDFAVGKTAGGSIEFEYSVVSYDENGSLTGYNVIYDGSPWFNGDGTYSKKILCADSDWKRVHPGESMLMDSFDPPLAMQKGLSMVTDIAPGKVTLKNADNGYAFGDTYISYRNMDCFTEAFNYNCNGAKVGNKGARNMTVTVSDKTDLRRHVDEAGN